MSLCNIILQRPAGYLITDSGFWDADTGDLVRLAPKVLELRGHGIALSGRGDAQMCALLLRELQHFSDQRAGVSGEQIIQAFEDIYFAASVSRQFPGSDITSVLYYSPAERRTRAYVITNGDNHHPLTRWQLTPIGATFSTGTSTFAPLGVPCDVHDPAQFDVQVDGAKAAMIQRVTPWESFNRTGCLGHYVAGTVYLTTVDAEGVRTEPLIAWDDQVGKPVDPNLQPTSFPRFGERQASTASATSAN